MSVGVPFAVIASLTRGQDKQELQAYRKLLVTVGGLFKNSTRSLPALHPLDGNGGTSWSFLLGSREALRNKQFRPHSTF